jgi:preprotein translocase subunit SecE
MTDEIKAPGAGATDKVKAAVAVLLVLGGIVGFYVLSTLPSWQRWLIVVGSLVLAAGALVWSAYGRALWQFVLDSRVELRKIVWPNREETLRTTAIVFAFVGIAGVFFWLVDLALAAATRFLSGQG